MPTLYIQVVPAAEQVHVSSSQVRSVTPGAIVGVTRSVW
jgi:hypothetical protein